jgi:hypothetical protein
MGSKAAGQKTPSRKGSQWKCAGGCVAPQSRIWFGYAPSPGLVGGTF